MYTPSGLAHASIEPEHSLQPFQTNTRTQAKRFAYNRTTVL